MNKLPDKPSELIRLALRDLRVVEADERYYVNMEAWHRPPGSADDRQVCEVCLAGSVMAKSLKEPWGNSVAPGDYDGGENGEDIDGKLWAINEFREGRVLIGLYQLWLDIPGDPIVRVHITEHDVDREAFHADMASLADKLEQHGL